MVDFVTSVYGAKATRSIVLFQLYCQCVPGLTERWPCKTHSLGC